MLACFSLELLISPGSILTGHLHTFCSVQLGGAPFLGNHRTSVRFSIAVERSQLPFFWLTLYPKVFLSISIFKKTHVKPCSWGGTTCSQWTLITGCHLHIRRTHTERSARATASENNPECWWHVLKTKRWASRGDERCSKWQHNGAIFLSLFFSLSPGINNAVLSNLGYSLMNVIRLYMMRFSFLMWDVSYIVSIIIHAPQKQINF